MRTVLNTAGVQVILYPFYLSFARQAWKTTNRVSGDSAVLEAGRIAAKWQSRGLSAAVMERISYEVFSIDLPDVE